RIVWSADADRASESEKQRSGCGGKKGRSQHAVLRVGACRDECECTRERVVPSVRWSFELVDLLEREDRELPSDVGDPEGVEQGPGNNRGGTSGQCGRPPPSRPLNSLPDEQACRHEPQWFPREAAAGER